MMSRALILIDWQVGLDHPSHWGGVRANPDAEANGLALLAEWRKRGWPIAHVFHDSTSEDSPLRPHTPGHAPKAGFEPRAEEPTYHKSVNSAFIGTSLEADLKARNLTDLVICGLTTNHCVSTSTRMAGNLGFDVILVGDACGAHPQGRFDADTIHAVSLANLDGEFCRVVNTSDILATLRITATVA
jgi:nicotinamidase-related amidase